MKKKNQICLFVSATALVMFVLWTVAVSLIDVNPIGPEGTMVGLSAFNGGFHNLTGVNMLLYTVTDWLGLVPIFVAFCFALLGLAQWIKRKKLKNVDTDIILLGAFYIMVISVYLLFEFVTVNYRPILINRYLETSYPSSTTMLVLTVMPTALIQLRSRIKNEFLRNSVILLICLFVVFMVTGRTVSGVHWLSDIIGGILLSISLVGLYSFAVGVHQNNDSIA